MPVTRFRTFLEAEQALWCTQPDAAYFQQLRALLEFGGRLSPAPGIRPGVYKYRAIDDAAREQDQKR